MIKNGIKPKKRSYLRILAGKTLYTLIRYIYWIKKRKEFSTRIEEKPLPYICFEHKTPLFRNLSKEEMIYQENKARNLSTALKKIDHIFLAPGKSFSFWRLIGKPTKKRGYSEGFNLFYGKIKPAIGGGLCQLSNLIYWIALHTPLTITERYRHSYDVFPDSNRTQPFGTGATCVFPYRDLQIQNNTSCFYQFEFFIKDNYLHGRIRSSLQSPFTYTVYEKKHWITHEIWGGYIRHNILHRQIFNTSGDMVDDRYLTENHALMMYQPFIEKKDGK